MRKPSGCRVFLAAGLAVGLAAPAQAADDRYPVRAEVRADAGQAVSPAQLRRIENDYTNRHDSIQAAGGKALARTDVGYGAVFRVRYVLRDAVIDEYSGIFDGGLMTCRFDHPRRFAEALALARAFQGKAKSEATIDFGRPTSRTASEVRYEVDLGCVAACIFRLNKAGACTEIQWSSAC